jgi:AP2 domain.
MLTHENLHQKIEYDQETGLFYWKYGSRQGKIVGCEYDSGYRYIWFKGRLIGAHRLAWLYMYNYLPDQIDHKDGNPSNNSLSNLRVANQIKNAQNKRHKASCKSGLKGIAYCKYHKKWRAEIGPRKQRKHLGYFNTPEEAHKTYCEAALQMYGGFACVN